MKHWLGNTLRGLCMGAADVIPGVSGGTIALILGLYPRLIDAAGNLGARTLRRVRTRSFWTVAAAGLKDPAHLRDSPEGTDAARLLLMASVAAGMLPAFAVGAEVLPSLLGAYPAQMRGFFLGLVLASVAVPLRELDRRGPSRWLLALAAALATAWFVGLPEPSGGHARGIVTLQLDPPPTADVTLTPQNLVLRAPEDGTRPGIDYGLGTSVTVRAGTAAVQTEVVARMAGAAGNLSSGAIREAEGPFDFAAVTQPAAFTGGRDPALAFLFVAGLLAISAMALPGISGSFVLLLLGLYHFVLHTLSSLISYRDPEAAVVIGTFVAALAIGLLTAVRVLKQLFARWRDGTLAVLVGLMLGSLRKLWPFTDYTAEGREVLTWPTADDPNTVAVGLLFALGVAAVVGLDRTGRRRRRVGQSSPWTKSPRHSSGDASTG